MSDRIILCDVAPRDGIQNEKITLSPALKLGLIRRIAAAGVPWIEVASFASPKWVPQMADAEEVFRVASKIPGIRPIVLVLNDRGYERAVAAGARYIRLVVAATDTMNRKNAHALPDATMDSYKPIFVRAPGDGVELTGTIATAFGCPFEGAVDPDRVLRLAAKFVEAGAAEVDFADTVGMAVPPQIERILKRARRQFTAVRIGIHVHNTRNLGLANAYAAVSAGADVLDASTGGAGGCPFAPKATGNIPMDDLVFMLEAMGVKTGVDLDQLLDASRWSRKSWSTPCQRCCRRRDRAGIHRRRSREAFDRKLICGKQVGSSTGSTLYLRRACAHS
ncbi:MAG TPA: hydroxymethylglutaryl-CoA lyase [Candidatus Binataceae bacterium]|nr:hydroxymethylglutaryl-CoA lyase [Candidatus Binataceae bacterium]